MTPLAPFESDHVPCQQHQRTLYDSCLPSSPLVFLRASRVMRLSCRHRHLLVPQRQVNRRSLCSHISDTYIRFLISPPLLLEFWELGLKALSDRFGFLLLHLSTPLLHEGPNFSWDEPYGIMAGVLLGDLSILSLISLMYTICTMGKYQCDYLEDYLRSIALLSCSCPIPSCLPITDHTRKAGQRGQKKGNNKEDKTESVNVTNSAENSGEASGGIFTLSRAGLVLGCRHGTN